MERIKLNIQKFAENTIEVELAATIDELQKSITKANGSLDSLKNKIKGTKQETDSFKSSVKELRDAFSKVDLSRMGSAIGQGLRNFRALTNMGKSFYNNFLTKSIDTSEELNLFNVVFDNIQKNGETTFSELGKHATDFQKKLNEAFGTNMKETMRFQGLFQSMGESAGLSEDVANLMSENMTKLSYDLASLYNTTETKAAESLRAGVYAGQTKPLRNYGIDVTQTSFKPIMEELGLEKSVNELSQAEKEILRYIATLNQAKNAMGDFANTIESPANQLKVLKQQFYEMQAAIGNLFVGAFARILPYVNAIIMVIKEVAKAIASFFGIEIQDFNSGIASYAEDLDAYSDGVGGIGDSADKAAGSIKALKRQVLGFDQINNLTSPTPSSGGSSGGGGGAGGGVLGGIDDKLLAALKGYDNGMEKVRMKANQIRDKMMEILGFTRDINGEWEWGGFSALVKNFTKWFGDLDFKGKVLVVGGMVTAFTTLFKIIKKIGDLTGVTALFKTIGKSGSKLLTGKVAAGTAGAGTAATAGAGTAGTAAAGSAGVPAGLVALGAIGEAIQLKQLSDTIDMIDKKVKNSVFAGKGIDFSWLDKMNIGVSAFNLIFAPTTPAVALTEIKKVISMFKKSIEPVKLSDILDLAGASKKTKETLGVVLKDYENFTKDLNTLKVLGQKQMDESGNVLGTVITQANVDELKRLFGEATTVTINGMEDQRKEVIGNLDKIKDKLGPKYDEIKETINSKYKEQEDETKNANEKITKILDTALKDRGYITQDEMDKINKIRETSQDKAITNLSDSEAEMLAIRQTMKDNAVNLNVTQASEILKKSAETRDKTIEDAKTQYDNILKEAEKLKAAKLINEDEYKAMRDAAKTTYDENVKKAKDQHKEIYDEFAKQNEDVAKYIDEDTGKVIPTWKAYCNKIGSWWKSLWGETDDDFQKNTRPKLKKSGEDAVDDVNEGIKSKDKPKINLKTSNKTEVQSQVNTATSGVTGSVAVGVNLPSSYSISQTLGGILGSVAGSLNLNFSKKADGGVFANGRWQPVQAYANGGIPAGGQLFMAREAGPELVGRIGRHTAVMNNNQIVDSVKAGVYEAVSAAMSNGGMGSVQIDLHTDEGVVVDRINKITRQTGVCPIDI